MYKAANARLLLRSLSPNSAALASVNPGRAASSARLALSLPCGAWVGRSGLVRRAAAFSGTRPRFAGARAQIGAAVPAVEQFQRRMATQGACARALVFVRPRVGSSVWSWVVCLSRARGAGRGDLGDVDACASPRRVRCFERCVLARFGLGSWSIDGLILLPGSLNSNYVTRCSSHRVDLVFWGRGVDGFARQRFTRDFFK
jgi:hypothetical protein